MKKITAGFVGLFAMVLLVSGVAFALFSSTVTVSGLTLSTATPGLKISPFLGEPYATTLDASTLAFAPLAPGESDWGELWLMNDSNGTTDPIDMDVTGQLKGAAGNWNELKDAVELRFCVYDVAAPDHCDESSTSDWYTLAEWYDAPIAIPPVLLQGAEMHYAINLRIDSSFGNAVANKTVNNITFDFVGTQIVDVE